MAHSFILHVLMRWDERGVYDISLWGLVVNYAVWLYNRTPNRVSGISPLELLTGKKSDHWNLLRAQGWGCPCYVLD